MIPAILPVADKTGAGIGGKNSANKLAETVERASVIGFNDDVAFDNEAKGKEKKTLSYPVGSSEQ